MTHPTATGLTREARGAAEAQDRSDLTQMMYRLGRCLDEHGFAELSDLFDENATAHTPGGTAHGREAVIAQATRNHEQHRRLQHMVSNVLIDFGEGDAQIRANAAVVFADEDGRVESTLGAVYRIDARPTSDGWRFVRLEVSPVWRVEPRA